MRVSEDACVDAHAGHAHDYVSVNDPTCAGKGFLPPGAPCEGWRRGECSGACVGREPMQAHEQRLRRVLADWRAPHWPHAGPIAVAEQGRWHLLYRWRHLGTVDDLSGAGEVLRKPAPAFDRQVFRILAAFLARPEANPVGLAPTSG